MAATVSGYVQAVVDERLMAIAGAKNLIVHLFPRPGDYITRGEVIVRLYGDNAGDDRTKEKIRACLVLGTQRSATQDIRFLFEQLTEIAVRALSPGINDPFTAMNCIDHLGAGLALLAGRKIPSPFRYEEKDRRTLRVITQPVTFPEVADLCLGPIRRSGTSSLLVQNRMLQMVRTITPFLKRSEDRAALIRHVNLIREATQSSVFLQSDRAIIEASAAEAERSLTAGGP